MRVIVAGSRTISDRPTVETAMQRMIANRCELVCGMARGVDLVARDIALEHGLTVHEFPADWDRYGKSAGYKRNAEMAQFADGLIAIWDGESRGTENMINTMRKLGKRVVVVSR